MALAILPIAFLAGLVLGDVRRATVACVSICAVGIMALVIAKLAGLEASPWEALALVILLPLAIFLARWAARMRPR